MTQSNFNENRRGFLTKVLSLAAIGCLGCKSTAAQRFLPDNVSKLSEDLGMTTEEIYSFFYSTFIPVLKSLSAEMGSEKFIAILTKVTSDNLVQVINEMTKDLPEKEIKGFSDLFQGFLSSPPYNSAFTYEIAEQTDKVLELKYTECLPAKLFRSMNAVDIGYALECSGAKAAAKAFNPKISVSNPKNILKGDSVCIERFTLES